MNYKKKKSANWLLSEVKIKEVNFTFQKTVKKMGENICKRLI